MTESRESMGVGFGLIGCGRMGRALAEVVRDRLPGSRMVAGYDAFAPAVEQFSGEFHVMGTDSLERMLDCPDLDAVIVASPNSLHCQHTAAAAAAGKHVFCEKPMALSVADCDRMIAACDEAGSKLMVGHSTRLMPLVRRLRELAQSGELGDPVFGSATYFFDGFKPRASGAWHVNRDQSGGLLFHMGIHQIDLFHALFGLSRRVQYAGGRYGAQAVDFDDVASVLVEFTSGATGVISATSLAHVPAKQATVLFSNGYAALDSPYTHLEFARGSDDLVRVAAAEVRYPDALEVELTSFVEWVVRDECPLLRTADARAAVALAEAADRARESGLAVEIDQP